MMFSLSRNSFLRLDKIQLGREVVPDKINPMKILHLVETPGQGSGRHVIDLAEGMRDRGHEVHIAYSPVRASPDFRRELDRLGGGGVTVRQITMHRRPGVHDLASLIAVRGYLRRHGPFDVVHGHSSKAGALARLAALGTNIVRLYTPNALVTLDPMLRPAERRIYALVERWLGRVGDAVITVSPEEHAEALALGIPPHRVFLIYSGIKLPVAKPRAEARLRLGLRREEVCVGFVGRLVRQKAPQRLLDGFAAAAAARPELRLLIVGNGELEAELRTRAQLLAIADRIVWTGEIPSVEVFAAIDIFALPSRFEGLSYSTMEAMGFGIPVVATDAGGARALVDHGTTGFVIEQGPERRIVEDFAAALGMLADDEGLRRQMSQAAMEMSLQFRAPRMVADVLDLYALLRARRGLGLLQVRSRVRLL
jgi:glycosyltransferase involved in cell wall biosynthesis